MMFNMGIGFVVVVFEENVEVFVEVIDSCVIGCVEVGDGVLICGFDF